MNDDTKKDHTCSRPDDGAKRFEEQGEYLK